MGNQCCSEAKIPQKGESESKNEYEVQFEKFQQSWGTVMRLDGPIGKYHSIEYTWKSFEKQMSPESMHAYNRVVLEIVVSNQVRELLRQQGDLMEFLTELNYDLEIEQHSFFLTFLFKRLQKACQTKLSIDGFPDILTLLLKNKKFLSQNHDPFVFGYSPRTSLMLHKISILTKLSQFVHFKLTKKSLFGGFWKGDSASFISELERETERISAEVESGNWAQICEGIKRKNNSSSGIDEKKKSTGISVENPSCLFPSSQQMSSFNS